MEHNHITLPEGSIEKTTTTLNIGPTHPATHGVFQNIMEVDGERIVSSDQTVGYIHRAFEYLVCSIIITQNLLDTDKRIDSFTKQ